MKPIILITAVAIFLSLQIRAVPFKLINKSAKSIPLIIPGVMNPNLSPFSSSGVDLKVGQKIFFKVKGKRHLLLIVDESLEGEELDVKSLLRQRKKELELPE